MRELAWRGLSNAFERQARARLNMRQIPELPMTRKPYKHPCAHPNCRAWALRGGTLCSAHAGRHRLSARQPREIEVQPAPSPDEMRIPTLESEIALLAARRDRVDRMLQKRMNEKDCEPREALRYLSVLCQVGKSLAVMLVQHMATSSAADIERFFEAIAERVRELQPAEEPVSHE